MIEVSLGVEFRILGRRNNTLTNINLASVGCGYMPLVLIFGHSHFGGASRDSLLPLSLHHLLHDDLIIFDVLFYFGLCYRTAFDRFNEVIDTCPFEFFSLHVSFGDEGFEGFRGHCLWHLLRDEAGELGVESGNLPVGGCGKPYGSGDTEKEFHPLLVIVGERRKFCGG